MSYQIDLKEIEKRAQHAAFQDGVMEIFMGVMLIFFGGAMGTRGILTPFIVFAIFFAGPILKRIKQRYIYPRVGYVKLPQESEANAKGIGIAALLFVLFLIAALVTSLLVLGADAGRDFFMTWVLPPCTGFMMSIGPFWLGQTYGLKRGYILAAIFLLGGIAMPVFEIASGYLAVSLLTSVVGVVSLLIGLVMFIRFLRRYPAQEIQLAEANHVE